MDPYVVVLAGFGAVVLLTAWLPMVLKELPLSLPIVCVGLGVVIFSLPAVPGVAPHPQEHLAITQRLTEFVVLIALMGAGLKLDRALAWVTCALTWRLLGIAMPLTIALLAVLGHALLGLGAAAAILLGAALAPTDPVLASDVQVGPPGEGLEDEVRFTLTSEAGLNDGLAFPFVNLAIALALAGQTGEPWLVKWLTVDVLWKLSAGLVAGWIVGRVLGWLTFRLPNRARLSRTGDGFVALGITCLAYGLTEMIHGYGFLAVFVAALGLRSAERNSKYHEKLHDFTEQLERLTMMMLLVLFGGADRRRRAFPGRQLRGRGLRAACGVSRASVERLDQPSRPRPAPRREGGHQLLRHPGTGLGLLPRLRPRPCQVRAAGPALVDDRADRADLDPAPWHDRDSGHALSRPAAPEARRCRWKPCVRQTWRRFLRPSPRSLESRPCLTPPPAAARRSRGRPERDRGCGAGRSRKPRRPPASSPRRAGAAGRRGAR